MNIFEIVIILLIGGLIGYLVCLISWIKDLSNEITMLNIELAKIKGKLVVFNGNDSENA